jgi:hypothetical protein
MIAWWWMTKRKGFGRKRPWPILRHQPSIYLKTLRKPMKTLRYQDWDSPATCGTRNRSANNSIVSSVVCWNLLRLYEPQRIFTFFVLVFIRRLFFFYIKNLKTLKVTTFRRMDLPSSSSKKGEKPFCWTRQTELFPICGPLNDFGGKSYRTRSATRQAVPSHAAASGETKDPRAHAATSPARVQGNVVWTSTEGVSFLANTRSPCNISRTYSKGIRRPLSVAYHFTNPAVMALLTIFWNSCT